MDESIDSSNPEGVPQGEQKSDKPLTTFLVGSGFVASILVLGLFLNMARLRPALDDTEAIEIQFNCRASEQSGVILCISYLDNLSGYILNNSDETVFVIKEVENSEGALGYALKSNDTEWSMELAVGRASYESSANYHVYHIIKNTTYHGMLVPAGMARTCPNDRHCA